MPKSVIVYRDRPLILPEGWSMRPEDQISSRATGRLCLGSRRSCVLTLAGSFYTSADRGWRFTKEDQLEAYLAYARGALVERAHTLDVLCRHPEYVPDWMADGAAFPALGDIARDEKGEVRVRFFCWPKHWWDRGGWVPFTKRELSDDGRPRVYWGWMRGSVGIDLGQVLVARTRRRTP